MIGRRLRDVREELLIPRTSFALKCGVSMNRLNNYEAGRSILPWSIGHELCSTFEINEVWLYNGTGDKWSPIIFKDKVLDPRRSRMAFSEVLRELLSKRPEFQDFVNMDEEGPPRQRPIGLAYPTPAQKQAATQFLSGPVYHWLAAIPPNKTDQFITQLSVAGKNLVHRLTSRRGRVSK